MSRPVRLARRNADARAPWAGVVGAGAAGIVGELLVRRIECESYHAARTTVASTHPAPVRKPEGVAESHATRCPTAQARPRSPRTGRAQASPPPGAHDFAGFPRAFQKHVAPRAAQGALLLGLALLTPAAVCAEPAQGDASAEAQSALRAPRGDARASQGPSGAPPEALAHYQRGRALYLEGRYNEALDELSAALTFDPSSAELHYNVARLHELLGQIDAAIAAYEAYRRYVPADDSQELMRTDATLKRLRGARSEVKPVAEPRIVTIERPAPRRGVADAWFWGLGGVGVAALVGAGAAGSAALWLDGQHTNFVLGRDGSARDYEHEGTRLRRLALATDGLTVAGSTLTLSAILVYALRVKPVQPVISVGARGGDVWLGLRGRL